MTSTEHATTAANTREESFASLFDASMLHADSLKEGEIVQGTVIKVNRDTVVVDIGGKSEGVIPANEFTDASGKVNVKAGDRVDVFIESRENDDGLVALSKEKADKMKVWDEISRRVRARRAHRRHHQPAREGRPARSPSAAA